MISSKELENGTRRIEVLGSRLDILADILAPIDAVTKVAFKDDEQKRISFIKDIPYMVLEAQSTMTTIEFPFPPEDMKKFGGEKE